MMEIGEYVESILKNYPGMKQQLKVLEYELAGLQKTLDSGLIEDKVLSRSGIDRVSGVQPRDQTADIVVEHVDRQRNAKYHALTSVIYTMGHEIRRLEYYLSLLTEEDAAVLRRFYFDGANLAAIAKSALVSQSTVQRRKKRSFETLVKYYSTLDNLPAEIDDLRTETRFVSYLHEERYMQCLERVKDQTRIPGIEAMMYLISGCNELWSIGIDAFMSFDTGEVIPQDAMMETISAQAAKLLRLAYRYALGFNPRNLSHIINSYFLGLEYVYLELAIESLRVAQIFALNS